MVQTEARPPKGRPRRRAPIVAGARPGYARPVDVVERPKPGEDAAVTASQMTFALEAWSCWAPGLDRAGQWAAWLRGECRPARDGAPELKNLKPVDRRRLNRIGRAVYACASEAAGGAVPAATVMCSEHGEVLRSFDLLASIARNEPLSPNHFSLSVHNAVGGLVSIYNDWRTPMQCIAAGREGIGAAFLASANALARCGSGESVLLVAYDDVVPDALERYVESPPETAVAVALRLSKVVHALPRVTAMRAPSRANGLAHWDQIRHFVAWLASQAGELALETGNARWSWRFEASAR